MQRRVTPLEPSAPTTMRAVKVPASVSTVTPLAAGVTFWTAAAYGFGAQAVEVLVDTETGKIRVVKIVAAHDVGRAINPMYVEGQIEGGLQMGLGYALTEELQVKEGQILNPTFLDYRIPTALDMPAIETVIVETADPEGPFGAKGVGEMGGTPTAAAIANAVYDAVGIRLNQLPMTPERVLQALRETNAAN